jgi:prepilin-type N-terminal cleavage/methylation domain-containing protein
VPSACSIRPSSAFVDGPPRTPRRASGFTLLEVLIALTLLTGSLLVVAQLMVVAVRAGEASKETSMATALAAQKIEQLRSLAWGMAPDGATADDVECDVAFWPDRPSGGPGLALSPPDSLSDNTPGYVDYLDSAGRWIGSGSSPPGPAAFVRRWSIEPAGPSSPATLVLRVVVWRRAPSWTAVGTGAPGWLPTLQLNGAKARRGE